MVRPGADDGSSHADGVAGESGAPLSELSEVLREARPLWSDRDLAAAESKLEVLGISGVDGLRRALAGGRLNRRLEEAGLKQFSVETLQALRSSLSVELRPRRAAAAKGPAAAKGGGAAAEAERGQGAGRRGAGAAARGEKAEAAPAGGSRLSGGAREAELPSEDGAAQDDREDSPIDRERQEEHPGGGVPSFDELLARLDDEDRAAVSERAEELGIPVPQLEDKGRAAALLEQIQGLEALTASQLRAAYEDRGFLAHDQLQRGDLIPLVKEVMIWEEMRLSALRLVACRDHGIPASDVDACSSKREVLALLAVGSWESAGIPVKKLGGHHAAQQLRQDVRELQAMSVQQLVTECKASGLPAEPRPLRDELLARVRQLAVWRRLPLAELLAECRQRGLPPSGRGGGHTPADHKEELLRQLVRSMWVPIWESAGVPVGRLRSHADAEELYKQVGHLPVLNVTALEKELRRKHGMPADPGAGKHGLVERLQELAVWQHLPLPELQLEAKRFGLEVPAELGLNAGAEARRKELLRSLLNAAKLRAWKSRGLPVDLLGSDTASRLVVAEALGSQLERVEAMSLADLKDWYTKTGLPDGQSVDRGDLVKLLQAITVWEALPTEELRRECARRGAPPAESADKESEEVQRRALLGELLVHERLRTWEAQGIPVQKFENPQTAAQVVMQHEAYQRMKVAELKEAYTGMGLPLEQGLERQDMLKTIKTVLIWELLPSIELERQCKELQLPLHKIQRDGKETQEQRHAWLVQLLLVNRCKTSYEVRGIPVKALDAAQIASVAAQFDRLERLTLDELKTEYKEIGLPLASSLSKDELLSRMRDLALWYELPASELRAVCLKRSVSLSGVRKNMGDAQEREALTDLLLYDMCVDEFKAAGVPVQKLGTFRSSANVAAEWAALDALSMNDIVKRYSDMGISARNLGRREIVERLRLVALWLEIPLKDLQKECREFGINSIAREEERVELVLGLVAVQWGDPQPAPQYVPPPPSFSPGGMGWPPSAPPMGPPGAGRPPWGAFGGAFGGMPGRPPGGYMPPPGGAGPRPPRPGFTPPPFGAGPRPGTGPRPSAYGGRPPWPPGSGPRPPAWAEQSGFGFSWQQQQPPPPAKPASGGAQGMVEHFQTLQLPTSAGTEDVKRAYKKLALKYHPDKNQGGAEKQTSEQFRKVAAAYEKLTTHLRGTGR